MSASILQVVKARATTVIGWDGRGEPPYLEALLAALDRSLDEATFCYPDFLWMRRNRLKVVHPWLVEAHGQLATRLVKRW